MNARAKSGALALIAALIAALVGCSRLRPETRPGPAARPPLASPSRVAVPSNAPSAGPPEARNEIPLRHTGEGGSTPSQATLAIAPGSEPCALYRAGTALVAQATDGDSVEVTEWDLASKTPLHRASLKMPGANNLGLLALAGQTVRLMGYGYNGTLYYAQLGAGFMAAPVHAIGTVSARGPTGFASDGTVAAIISDGVLDRASPDRGPRGALADDPDGLFVASFDASGHLLGKRIVDREQDGGDYAPMMYGNLAVAGGHVYVALVDGDATLRVLKLGPDLRPERDRTLPIPTDYANIHATLEAADGHLVVDVPEHPDLVEVSLDLAQTTHRARPAPPPPFPGGGDCGPTLALGSGVIALCVCGAEECLAWGSLPQAP